MKSKTRQASELIKRLKKLVEGTEGKWKEVIMEQIREEGAGMWGAGFKMTASGVSGRLEGETVTMGSLVVREPEKPVEAKETVVVGESKPDVAFTPTAIPVENLQWPMEAELTLDGYCVNPRLLRAKLEDGRDVTMFRGKRNWRIPSKVMARLYQGGGNPIFSAI